MTVPNTINHLKMVAEKEGISYEEQALAVIAEKADGGMRDALSIFDQAVSFCQGNLTYQKVTEDLNVLDSDNYFKLIDCALENNVSEMMLLLNGILDKGFDGGNMIQGLAQHVRNVLMAKDAKTLPLLETSEAQKAKYQQQAQKAPTPFLYKALQIANKCDINYRQSSNKRLLVELTLIEIGQITQPEDKDIPSAGRTPNRLKSLFQKIVAQLKPASQGAGAGQESGSKAPVREAQPVAAATAAPISTVRKGSQVKLKGIGMSKALRADAQLIDCGQQLPLQTGIVGIGVGNIQRAEQCLLGQIGHLVKAAAHADAQHDGRAGVGARQLYGIHHELFKALHTVGGFKHLDAAHVLAAKALGGHRDAAALAVHQMHRDGGGGVVAGVAPAQRVGHDALAQIAVGVAPAHALMDGGFKAAVNVHIGAQLHEHAGHAGAASASSASQRLT